MAASEDRAEKPGSAHWRFTPHGRFGRLLCKRDRRRRIDRYLDYFGDGATPRPRPRRETAVA
jgi:hypothetical protein